MAEDDALMAEVERCLDGDLDRDERLALLERLAMAPDGSRIMAEAAALGRGLGQLAEAYDRVEPSAAFMAAAFMAAALERPAAAALPRRLPRFARAVGATFRNPVATYGWGGLAGAAVAALVFAYVLTPAQDIALIEQMAAREVRMHVLDVPFRVVADSHDWTHSISVAPGETVRLDVLKGHEGAYHLRVVGGGEVEFSLVHSRPKTKEEERRLKGGTVHYTSLMAPKPGDVLMVTNHGAVPIEVSVAAKDESAVTLKPHKEPPPKTDRHASAGPAPAAHN